MKTLISLLANHRVICTVGNSKNAGKTTVLNYLVTNYQELIVGISSIGLDGEKIDQITFLPKPRIYVFPKTIVATAKVCLTECEAEYEILEETKITTALGPIVLIKIKTAGNCLVGGPSTLRSMEEIIAKLKLYSCSKILIDGAFSRTTLAQISDATILCIGASYSYQLDKVILHANGIVKLFQLPKFLGNIDFKDSKDVVLVDRNMNLSYLNIPTTLSCGAQIIARINENTKYIYIPKAVSPSFLEAFIENRHHLSCDLIVLSPTHLIVNDKILKNLFKLKQKIYVINPINLVAVTFNPFSPSGIISSSSFKKGLEEVINLPIYNVLEKSI